MGGHMKIWEVTSLGFGVVEIEKIDLPSRQSVISKLNLAAESDNGVESIDAFVCYYSTKAEAIKLKKEIEKDFLSWKYTE
jgi:hypothetical protein